MSKVAAPLTRFALSVSPSTSIPHSTFLSLPSLSPQLPPITLTLSNLLLRDSSQHPTHLHPASQQKLIKSTQIPWSCKVVTAELVPADKDVRLDVANELHVKLMWDSPLDVPTDTTPAINRHVSLHPLSWLIRHATLSPAVPTLPAPTPWIASTLPATLSLSHSGAYLSSKSEVHSHLTSLLKNGIAFFYSVGSKSLNKIVQQVGTIRTTWYGQMWDVKAEEGSKNIAYTDLDLGLHMDLTHFVSPPRYQYLLSIHNYQIVGGSSYFVDTYHIVSVMKRYHPELYRALCEEDVEFRYRNGGKWTHFRRKTIEIEQDENGEDRIVAVNYSPPFQGELRLSKELQPLRRSLSSTTVPPPPPPGTSSTSSTVLPHLPPLVTRLDQGSAALFDNAHTSTSTTDSLAYVARLERLYRALKIFDKLCEKKENQWTCMLEEGDCVVFDNRRVLHGRRAFRFMNEKEVAASELAEKSKSTKYSTGHDNALNEGDEEVEAAAMNHETKTATTDVENGMISSAKVERSSSAIASTSSALPPTSSALSASASKRTRGRWLKGAYLDEDEVYSKWRMGELKRMGNGMKVAEKDKLEKMQSVRWRE